MEKLLISIFTICYIALISRVGHGFEYTSHGESGQRLKVFLDEAANLETNRMIICSENPDFRIQNISLVTDPPAPRVRHQKVMTWAMTDKNCFQITQVQFTRPGAWTIQVTDQDKQLYSLPILVSSGHFSLKNEVGHQAQSVYVAGESSKGTEPWLLCGVRKVNDVYLMNLQTKEKFSATHLPDFGKECRLLATPPHISKGVWKIVAKLDNNEKISGKVVFK